MKKYWILFWGIVQMANASGQTLTVYPGDANNNGRVNNIDLLYLGLAYNYIGPARDSNVTVFAPQQAAPWNYNFFNGLNFAHADCDGDGIVNYYYDAFPIYVNYGSVRPGGFPDTFIPGMGGVDPELKLDGSGVPNSIHSGEHLQIPIVLGSAAHPVEDLYGIAFSLLLDTAANAQMDVQFDFSENSWANPDNDRIYLYKKRPGNQFDVGWVRTDHNNVSGFGEIGRANIIIIVDVIDYQQLNIKIENIKMIDKFGNETAVAGSTLSLNMASDTPSAVVTPKDDHYFDVQPNPASGFLQVSHDAPIEQLQLSDAMGRVVLSLEPGLPVVNLQLPHLPAGLYLLQGRSRAGIFRRKVQIQ